MVGICRATMATSQSLGAALPDEGHMRVSFDDSIITDTVVEKQQNMTEVMSGLMEPTEYRAKWYGNVNGSESKRSRP